MMNYAPYVQRNLEAGMRVMIYLGTGAGIWLQGLHSLLPVPSPAARRLGMRADQGCACAPGRGLDLQLHGQLEVGERDALVPAGAVPGRARAQLDRGRRGGRQRARAWAALLREGVQRGARGPCLGDRALLS